MWWFGEWFPHIRVRRERQPAPEGWFLLAGQRLDESVAAAVTRSARDQGIDPEQVMGALVLGYPDTDEIRDWPRWLYWRHPGFKGDFRHLRGYRRVQIELQGILGGPN
ncbi:MAG: hypothetical protein RKP20_11330 [Candidatus Competibacter sp.]|nr:hypothetical protein [Candidatus Competibacter sp.]